MAQEGLSVGVVGATGALGKEVIAALERAPFTIRQLVCVASPGSHQPEVSFLGTNYKVLTLSPETLEQMDLVIAALPVGPGDDLLREAAEAGCTVIDLAGIWANDPGAPLGALGITSVEMDAVREVGVARAAGPIPLVLGAIGAAIRQRSTLLGVRGTVLMPASVAGRAGVDELSGQVVAMFNSREPPRSTFRGGLAFDLLPSWGDLSVEGWSVTERRAAEETGRILGLPAANIALSVVVAPMFAGMGMSLQVFTESGLGAAGVTEALASSGLVSLHDAGDVALQPRGKLGQAVISVGRIRDDPQGAGVHLWVSADPLRLTAANAVALVADLVLQDLI